MLWKEPLIKYYFTLELSEKNVPMLVELKVSSCPFKGSNPTKNLPSTVDEILPFLRSSNTAVSLHPTLLK